MPGASHSRQGSYGACIMQGTVGVRLPSPYFARATGDGEAVDARCLVAWRGFAGVGHHHLLCIVQTALMALQQVSPAHLCRCPNASCLTRPLHFSLLHSGQTHAAVWNLRRAGGPDSRSVFEAGGIVHSGRPAGNLLVRMQAAEDSRMGAHHANDIRNALTELGPPLRLLARFAAEAPAVILELAHSTAIPDADGESITLAVLLVRTASVLSSLSTPPAELIGEMHAGGMTLASLQHVGLQQIWS